jgi:hypothetical protein
MAEIAELLRGQGSKGVASDCAGAKNGEKGFRPRVLQKSGSSFRRPLSMRSLTVIGAINKNLQNLWWRLGNAEFSPSTRETAQRGAEDEEEE